MHFFTYFKKIFQCTLLSSFIFGAVACNNEEDNKDDIDKEEFCVNTFSNELQTLSDGVAEREFILFVPDSYNQNNPIPLLINFHGFGGCAVDFVEQVGSGPRGLNEVANNNNFIVAYPQGVSRVKGSPEWDPGDNGFQSILDNDVFFVEQLIADISNQFNIDPLRIYAAGYSNGGMMAYGLACTKSNLFAAIGVMSGIMLEDICDENRFTSVIHFHGIEDDVLPLAGNQDFQSVSAVIDFWLNHNGIPESNRVRRELNNGNVTLEQFTGGNGNTDFTFYTINREFDKPGGHVWFTGDIEGVSPNQIMWDFLEAYKLDD